MRSAGSGVNSISPDIIVLKEGKGFAFECKAWDNTSLSIEPDKYEVLIEWEKNTGMQTFIAWRMSGKKWFFVRLSELRRTEKNYVVTRTTAMEIARDLEAMLDGEGLEAVEKAESDDAEEDKEEVEVELVGT